MRLVITKNFKRRFNLLPSKIKNRFLKIIEKLYDDPFMGIPLKGRLKGKRKIRVGKYRLIYMIDEDCVVLLDVGLRESIYKR